MGQQVLSTRHRIQHDTREWVDTGKMKGFRSASLSFIERLYDKGHSYYIEFFTSINEDRTEHVDAGVSILESIKGELDGGWLFTIKGLIAAEIFADFIEMAEYLLSNGYKDPAAVMTGSVLEEHLRQLCLKNGLDTEVVHGGKKKPKTADLMNADLTKASIYNKLDQKSVTAWLGLRNNAAHGNYNEYDTQQVENMMQGITNFITRNPV
ncbi:MAG TPA: hypothetical protein ENH13_01900 [Euryarchaeota archaeon]|nr:hypothetical protein [Euryarchaeota archaeon]